ncbi:helix-turn-helix domain-containing protein [Micromonospora zhanjiangensis]
MRRARQAAGLSQEDLAAKISYSAAQVSAVERAARRPSGDLADRVDTVLGLDGRMSRLLGAIRHEGARPELRPWLIIEAEATAIRSFQLSVIPGLLQTEAYARVALTAGECSRRPRWRSRPPCGSSDRPCSSGTSPRRPCS